MLDVRRYEKRLLERRGELDKRLRAIEADLETPGDPDAEERVVERENDEVLERLGLAGIEELRLIREALKRIDAGTYGICASCGEPIAEERLDVLPFTPLCRECVDRNTSRTLG